MLHSGHVYTPICRMYLYLAIHNASERHLPSPTLHLTAHLYSAYTDESHQTLYPVLDCRKVNLKLRATNQNIFNLSMDASVALSSLPSEACGALVAVAANVGNTKVTVALDTIAFGRLEATVTIAAYPPLTVSVVCTCIHALFCVHVCKCLCTCACVHC